MDFHEGKRRVLESLREVAELAEECGSRTLADVLLTDRIPRLEEERFHLVVLGEFNHGKTTFVNALLGETVLPIGVTPTTAVLHHIEFGSECSAVAVTQDSEERPLSVAELRNYVVDGTAARESIRHIELRYPALLLQEGVVLVDTPGVNDLNHQRAEITYGYIPRSDAIIFLLDAGQILKESERDFITKKLLAASRDKVFFVINKVDLLDDEEREEAVAYAKKHLAELVGEPKVFPLSAERALSGERARAGLDEFVVELRRFLQEERGRVLLDNALDQGIRTVGVLRTSIEVQRRALEMDRDELNQRLSSLEDDLNGSSATIETRKQQVRESLSAVKAMVRTEVDRFGTHFSAALPQEIEGSTSEDLRRYLPGFIEEKFREFAAEEGQEVGRRLERVAEEAIAFVAGDAEAQAERLREALGPAGQSLDLKVNTFAYDVGVFALGAFGITVMALSNVLVGGALALAAPVLAVLFRGRADRMVKERALEEAPKAVREAASKLGDAFTSQIDDFGALLLEFMDKASEEMTRSIADVIRVAKAAREEGDLAITKLESTTGTVTARLAAVEDQMKQRRNSLWS